VALRWFRLVLVTVFDGRAASTSPTRPGGWRGHLTEVGQLHALLGHPRDTNGATRVAADDLVTPAKGHLHAELGIDRNGLGRSSGPSE
jgi:hypothetical protein